MFYLDVLKVDLGLAHVGGTSSSHGAATSVEGGQGHGPYDDEGEH